MESHRVSVETFISQRRRDSCPWSWSTLRIEKGDRRSDVRSAEIFLGRQVDVTVDPQTGEIKVGSLDDGAPAYIQYSGQPQRLVFKGGTGTGKSTSLLYVVEQYINKIGAKAIILIDPKDEWTDYRPNLYFQMLPKEVPCTIEGVSLRPSFVIKQSFKEIRGAKNFIFGFLDFTPEELMTMAGTEPKMGAGTYRALSKAKDIYLERYGYDKPSLKKFMEIIDIELPNLENRPIAQTSCRAALGQVEFLYREQAIGDKTTIDVIGMAVKGKVPSIMYSMTIPRVFRMASCYSSMVLRQIHEWCSKALNEDDPYYGTHLLVVIDEAKQIAPRQGNPPSKKALIDTFQVARGIKVSCVLACLNLYDMDFDVLSQASKIIVLGNLGKDDKILRTLNFDPSDIELISRVCKYDSVTGERVGVILDPQNPKDMTFFTPTMPPVLFGHK